MPPLTPPDSEPQPNSSSPSPPAEESGPGFGPALVVALVIVALTVLLCVLVAGRVLTLGVPGEWVWQYHRTPGGDLVTELKLPVALFVVLLLAVWYLTRNAGEALSNWRRETLAVVLLVFLGLLFLVGVGAIWGGLGQDVMAIYQPSVGGYFALSEEVTSPSEFLAGFPQVLATREPVGHLNTHPPGNTMYFYVLRRFFERFPTLADWAVLLQPDSVEFFFDELVDRGGVELGQARRAAMFVGAIGCRLLAALIAVPLYLLGRSSLGKRRAVWAGALGLSVPAFLVFLPGFDAVYPTAAAAVAALMVGALVWRSKGLAVAAGAVLWVAMTFTPVMMLVVFVVLLWYVLVRLVGGGSGLERGPGQAAIATIVTTGLVGFAVPLAVVWLVLGFDSISTWWQCLASNVRFNRLTDRSYWPWVLYNPVDFLMFLGVGLSALLVLATVGLVRGLRRWRELGPVGLGLLALVAVLVVLNVSGANAGETGRLWMFLMPGAALLAVPALERLGPGAELVLVAVLLCQAVQACVFKLYLNLLFMT